MSINIQKLVILRESKGLTQMALDAKAGIGRGTVRRAELGGGITVRTLKKLAVALEVQPVYFLE